MSTCFEVNNSTRKEICTFNAILTGNDMFEHFLLPRESLSPSLVSFLIARASFIQIYSHFAKKKKKKKNKNNKK